MNISVPGIAAEAGQPPSDPGVIWYHPAFCQLALPVAAPQGSWRRETALASVAFEAAADQLLPAGWGLRLLLLRICDQAVRTGSPAIEMGPDAGSLAAELGIPMGEPVLSELTAQLERLLATKMTVSLDGQPALSVVDARGQSRKPAAATEWRPRIRLNARFHASLMEHAVALDRRIVATLAAEPMALDAHGWIRQILVHKPAGETETVSWDDLLRRFAMPEQDMVAFRAEFEDALRMVFAADVSIALAADDQGVTVGLAMGEAEPAPVAMADQAAVVSPVAEAEPHPADMAVERRGRQRDRQPDRNRDQQRLPLQAEDTRPVPSVQAVPPMPVHQGRPPPQQPREQQPRDQQHRDQQPRDQQSRDQQPRGMPQNQGGGVYPPTAPITDDIVSLRSQLTGLPSVVWLRRGQGNGPVVIGVTPGTRFDTDRLTVLMLEPLAMQVSGGLYQEEFDRVSAWAMANRDLIDLFWEGKISSFDEIVSRIKKVPSPGWR
jgi:hypothetical protein